MLEIDLLSRRGGAVDLDETLGEVQQLVAHGSAVDDHRGDVWHLGVRDHDITRRIPSDAGLRAIEPHVQEILPVAMKDQVSAVHRGWITAVSRGPQASG